MNRSLALLIASFLIATPVLAGSPVVKRPLCQLPKPAQRDVKRVETCRKPPIPPVIDPTPMFLASTAGSQPTASDLS